MADHRRNELLRAIPPVDEILSHPALAALRARHPDFPWTRVVRTFLDTFRERPPAELGGADRGRIGDWVAERLAGRVERLRSGGLRPVLNGTGVILHTNLGRAALAAGAADAGRSALARYVSLEIDAETGSRSHRGETLNELLRLATGAEACAVVNNNAAAVYLVANTFSPPGRILVSRGELVEIGGSFRMPEILRRAAANVVEVGTTNRTYADDYREAARPGDVIMKVHKSNYAIEGFSHETTPAELVAVGRDTGARVVYDLGSGALVDLQARGVGGDPTVSAVVAQGVDCVTMSGDKLLGGCQAGIIAGKHATIEALRQNPLRRAVRVDKVTIAVMQEVVRSVLFGTDPPAGVPVLAQILGPVDGIEARAAAVARAVASAVGAGHRVLVVDDDAAVGGGSLSTEAITSRAVAVECASEDDANRLARRLRTREPAVFPRVKGAQVRVNMRTILPDEDDTLIGALAAALAAGE